MGTTPTAVPTNHLVVAISRGEQLAAAPAREVIAILKPISAKGSLETVKRLCQRLNEVMVYSVNTGLIPANPLAGIGRAFNSPKVANMPTLKPEQLPELMQALNRANIKLVTRCLIEWQLHTMCRPAEAAGAKWSEINISINTCF